MDNSLERFFGDIAPDASVDGLTVEKKIGEGAMANLYLVRDAAGGQRVIKVPRQSFKVDPVSLVAFENELRLAPYLEDFPYAYMPRISGQASGQYLVMDYIQGVDLRSHLKEHGPLPEADAIALGKKIVRAVAELHRRRIVHLDLKLSNVMRTPEGEVRLIDFGLANHLDLPDLIYESFREPKGTPVYIAPEQFIGVRDEPRSDLFSVGVMLFELATGKLPYPDGSSVLDVINRIKRKPVSPRLYNPELSRQLERIIGKCLHADPDDRFADMDALYDALESWQTEPDVAGNAETISAAATGLAERIATLSRSVTNYCSGLFDRADHFGQITRWAERRSLSRGASPHRILAAIDLNAGDALNLEILRQTRQLTRLQPSLITVMSVLAVEVGMASGDKEAEIINEQMVKTRKKIASLLQQAGRQAAPVGVNVVIGNDPVGAITQCAEDYGIDLVVIGCLPKNPFANFIHGKTGYKILTSIKRSVFVVHAPEKISTEARAPAAIKTRDQSQRPVSSRSAKNGCSPAARILRPATE
ncbi:MAG: bifunctional serine/threonine-protein kinase/universal stress protein [Pseudomonadota bacterium]